MQSALLSTGRKSSRPLDPENYEVPRKYFKPIFIKYLRCTQIKNGFVHLRFPDNILYCTGNLRDEIGMMKAESFH